MLSTDMAIEQVKSMLHKYVNGAIDLDRQISKYERYEVQFGSVAGVKYSDMPKPPSPLAFDRRAIMIERMIDLAATIEKKLKAQKEYEAKINDILEQVDNPLEREVIRLRYLEIDVPGNVQEKKWKYVTEELFGERDDYMKNYEGYTKRTHRLHQSAINNMAKIITLES